MCPTYVPCLNKGLVYAALLTFAGQVDVNRLENAGVDPSRNPGPSSPLLEDTESDASEGMVYVDVVPA